MAAVTASACVLLGVGLLTVDVETRQGFRPSQPFLVSEQRRTHGAAGVCLWRHSDGGLGQGIQIAVPTVLAFALLAMGTLALYPDHGRGRRGTPRHTLEACWGTAPSTVRRHRAARTWGPPRIRELDRPIEQSERSVHSMLYSR